MNQLTAVFIEALMRHASVEAPMQPPLSPQLPIDSVECRLDSSNDAVLFWRRCKWNADTSQPIAKSNADCSSLQFCRCLKTARTWGDPAQKGRIISATVEECRCDVERRTMSALTSRVPRCRMNLQRVEHITLRRYQNVASCASSDSEYTGTGMSP